MRLPETLRRRDMWWLAGLVVADQVTKQLVVQGVPLHESVPVVPGLLNVTHVQNTGAAFGVLNGLDFQFKPLIVTALALVALVTIAAYALRFGTNSWLGHGGLVCILGGATGNLVDRVTRGYVVDFVDFYWGSFHFWAFNVADAAISVGAVALMLELFLFGQHVPEAT